MTFEYMDSVTRRRDSRSRQAHNTILKIEIQLKKNWPEKYKERTNRSKRAWNNRPQRGAHFNNNVIHMQMVSYIRNLYCLCVWPYTQFIQFQKKRKHNDHRVRL